MKPGDLVRVRDEPFMISPAAAFKGQIGVLIGLETTPTFLGGDEMCVILIGGSQLRFYVEEIEPVDGDVNQADAL